MESPRKWHGPARYQFTVIGIPGAQWTDRFEGMSLEAEAQTTTITADLPDQSALHGLLVRIRDLGLPLIRIKRME